MRQVNTLSLSDSSQCLNKIPSMNGSCHSRLVRLSLLSQSPCSSCLCKNTTLKASQVVRLNNRQHTHSPSYSNTQKIHEKLGLSVQAFRVFFVVLSRQYSPKFA